MTRGEILVATWKVVTNFNYKFEKKKFKTVILLKFVLVLETGANQFMCFLVETRK